MIYDKNSKKYVNIEELMNKKRKKKDLVIKLLKENNEKLNELINIMREVLKNGGSTITGTKEEAGDSETRAKET